MGPSGWGSWGSVQGIALGRRGSDLMQYRQGGPRRADECLTLHMQEDGGLSMSCRASGIADVLARILLGYAGDDQRVAFHPVLPGQWGAQLRPVDGGCRAACEVEYKMAEVTGLLRHQLGVGVVRKGPG